MTKPIETHRAGRAGAAAGGALALLLVLLGACDALDSALEVEAPSRIPSGDLDDPAKAPLLLTGAVADFECAFNAYTVMSGLVGEELVDATQTADRWPYDRREVSPSDRRYGEFDCDALGVYTPLSRARWAADNVLRNLEGWTAAELPAGSDRELMIARAAAYSGYAHLLLGEGFCSGVLLDAELTPGGEVPRAELLQRATERFGRALEAAGAAGSDEYRNMALVGRARARLGLGDLAGAAADAAQVPHDFVKEVSTSTVADRRYNRVYAQNNDGQSVSVGERYRQMTVDGTPDPRVRVTDTGRIATDGTPIWVQSKYEAFATPLPLATGDEARLIVAEASGGQAAVDIINAFRARASLPAFAGGSAEQIRAQVVEERRRELFLESHHLGDVIRHGLALEPAAGTPFSKGGAYGTTTCLPLPNVERLNNPAIGS